MNKALTGLLISLGFLVPAFASASVTITSVTLNGGSAVQVDPGANITVAVVATLTDSSKWKGANWGVNSGNMTTTCANTKNAKEGTHNNDTGVFTETFTIKAPGQPGLYNASFLADIANNCGKPAGNMFTLAQAVRVGANTTPPVISAHSDISVQLASPASGSAVTYINPFATDHYGNLVAVMCAPASGYFFPLGNTTVSCTATDSWGNVAIPSTFTVSILPPVVVPPADTEAPVIAVHADVHVTTPDTATVVSYTTPTAADNVDASVAVSCTPASGSTFTLGTTTITCTAQDAAGNNATSIFAIIVEQEIVVPPTPPAPVLYTMAGQTDESYLCGVENDSWRYCDGPGTFSFTDVVGEGIKTIDLGMGSSMGTGTLQTVIIARDENNPFTPTNPWRVSLNCYTDASYSLACADWVVSTPANGNRTDSIQEFAAGGDDGKHWFADFTNPAREKNFDGSAPVKFKPAYYYRLVIDDVGFETAAYGSENRQEPYWKIVGLH